MNLPLSWIYDNRDFSEGNESVGNLFGLQWLALKRFQSPESFQSFISDISKKSGEKYLIRGVNENTSVYFSHLGFNKYLIGKEAVIEISAPLRFKKSLLKLIKRGSKFGKVEEIKYSPQSVNELEKFRLNYY